MKKNKRLALAISSILFSGAASAVVSLDATPAAAADYASEVDVTSGALVDSGLAFAGAQDISHDIGFGISPGAVRYLRYDLSANATFSAALTSSNIQDATNPNTVFSLAGGGLAGESFVIFQITAGTLLVAADDIVPTDEIDVNILGLNVTDQAGVTFTYNQYEEGIDAQNGAPGTAVQAAKSLATASNQILDFSQDALALVCAPAPVEPIDVSTGANLFTGSIGTVNDNVIGDFQVSVQPALLGFNGLAVTNADTIVTSANVSVTGLATGIASLGDGGTNAYALVGGAFTTLATSLVDYNPPLTFTAIAPAAGQIPSGSILVSVAPTAMPNYTATTATGSCTLGIFARNGSQDRVTFLLTPGGNYKNFIRITNPSSLDGDVTLLLTDDTGASATFSLGDVAGNVALLNAGASTKLLSIDILSDAAIIANPALDITAKLRLDVFGEFGSSIFNSTAFNSVSPVGTATALAAGTIPFGGIITNGIDGLAGKDDINVQAFSQSKDKNSFFMMQKE